MKKLFAYLLTAVLILTAMSSLAEYAIGDVVTFGTYEQDNNTENGAEPIEWTVVKLSGDKAVLVSNKVLDCQPFCTGWFDAFSSSFVRKWLNGTFLREAFSAEEKKQIVPMTGYKNMVVLPSYNEANSLLLPMGIITCEPTPYAAEKGAKVDEMGMTGWWVREHYEYFCSYINGEGYIRAGSSWPAPNTPLGIRPMITISAK